VLDPVEDRGEVHINHTLPISGRLLFDRARRLTDSGIVTRTVLALLSALRPPKRLQSRLKLSLFDAPANPWDRYARARMFSASPVVVRAGIWRKTQNFRIKRA
jgi:hypothetical protein